MLHFITVDAKNPSVTQKVDSEPVIRTMKKDIERLTQSSSLMSNDDLITEPLDHNIPEQPDEVLNEITDGPSPSKVPKPEQAPPLTPIPDDDNLLHELDLSQEDETVTPASKDINPELNSSEQLQQPARLQEEHNQPLDLPIGDEDDTRPMAPPIPPWQKTQMPQKNNVPEQNIQEMVAQRIQEEKEIEENSAEQRIKLMQNNIKQNYGETNLDVNNPLADKTERQKISAAEEQPPQEFEVEMDKEMSNAQKINEQKTPVQAQVPKPVSNIPKSKKLLAIIITIGIIVVLAGASGFFYWWNYLRVATPDDNNGPGPIDQKTHFECQNNKCLEITGAGENLCQDDTQCQDNDTEIPEPISLIPVSSTLIVEISSDLQDLLIEKIINLTNQIQENQKLYRILIKAVDQTASTAHYLTTQELLDITGLKMPLNTQSDYSLIAYKQTTGIRLSLVVKTNLAEEETKYNLRTQEASLPANFQPLFLNNRLDKPSQVEFLDNTYKEVAIRYLNLPDPALTIDYTAINDLLVVATSKESIYAIIDALTAGQPPKNETTN